ncbi:hypothetical protein C5614_08945 [Massilia phosphatilytica]|nr:hypothetical protein C5614_08945 [Massilia phosphatilytica]
MRMLLLALAVCLGLAGCSKSDSEAQAALKGYLHDPDSVTFEESITYKNFKCLEYSVKNGAGGYAGSSWAIMEKRDYGWAARKLTEDFCNETSLKHAAHPGMAAREKEARRQMMAVLHDANLVSKEIDDEFLVPKGPCADMARDMTSYARRAVQAEDATERARWQEKVDKLIAVAKGGQCKSGSS